MIVVLGRFLGLLDRMPMLLLIGVLDSSSIELLAGEGVWDAENK